MYDGADCTVELKCENGLMDDIVDRFGEQVQTGRYDSSHFTACVQVSVSPTFYAWVFTYGGQIEILSPEPVRREYAQRLQAALKQAKKKKKKSGWVLKRPSRFDFSKIY